MLCHSALVSFLFVLAIRDTKACVGIVMFRWCWARDYDSDFCFLINLAAGACLAGWEWETNNLSVFRWETFRSHSRARFCLGTCLGACCESCERGERVKPARPQLCASSSVPSTKLRCSSLKAFLSLELVVSQVCLNGGRARRLGSRY